MGGAGIIVIYFVGCVVGFHSRASFRASAIWASCAARLRGSGRVGGLTRFHFARQLAMVFDRPLIYGLPPFIIRHAQGLLALQPRPCVEEPVSVIDGLPPLPIGNGHRPWR